MAAPLLLLAAPGPAAARPAAKAHRPAEAPAAAHKPAAAPTEAEPKRYAGREEVRRFADEVAQRHGLDAAWAAAVLGQARYLPQVARLIMPPRAGTAKNWAAYRGRFVEPERVRAGAAFWQAHERWLEEAEARWGVPAEIVVGIVGVETFYGRVTGDFRVIDALATLAFDFPPGRKDRSDYFRGELENLLLLAQREGSEPASYRGSYAGAMGLPQFMPGSRLKYAVDFDGDGRIDLAASAADTIGSVAHYLAEHGWQRGEPTHFGVAVPVDASDRAQLLAADILPRFSAGDFARLGAVLDERGARHDGPLALVELQNGAAAPSYVAGTRNFYAVTRYNWSSYYAMAVIELGRQAAALRGPR